MPHFPTRPLIIRLGMLGKPAENLEPSITNEVLRSQSCESTALLPNSTPLASVPTPLESITASTGEWLERIFESNFEMIFGFWMGKHSCPFVYEWLIPCQENVLLTNPASTPTATSLSARLAFSANWTPTIPKIGNYGIWTPPTRHPGTGSSEISK